MLLLPVRVEDADGPPFRGLHRHRSGMRGRVPVHLGPASNPDGFRTEASSRSRLLPGAPLSRLQPRLTLRLPVAAGAESLETAGRSSPSRWTRRRSRSSSGHLGLADRGLRGGSGEPPAATARAGSRARAPPARLADAHVPCTSGGCTAREPVLLLPVGRFSRTSGTAVLRRLLSGGRAHRRSWRISPRPALGRADGRASGAIAACMGAFTYRCASRRIPDVLPDLPDPQRNVSSFRPALGGFWFAGEVFGLVTQSSGRGGGDGAHRGFSSGSRRGRIGESG